MPDLQISIHDYVAKISRLDKSTIDADMALFSSGFLDSFAMIELVTFVEKEAGINVRAKDVTLENLDTIARILAFVQRQNA